MFFEKIIPLLYLIVLLTGCKSSSDHLKSIEHISDAGQQHSLFRSLINITNYTIPEDTWDDSLAFLILPVQVSCPSCREKTIDSILHHQNSLTNNHFIIISAKEGRKGISSYFREEGKDLPDMPNKLFLDSTNRAYNYSLYDQKPTIYYTYKRKAFRKVAVIPANVRNDLREFFSGNRNE